ncbi:putative skeletal organic matrix protein 5 [Exaiptasia diaphana]|nr:putative skeletal organic matrix protein 5 [Exaiptasia diaphana]
MFCACLCRARSLYSVIADNRYRRVSIGRNKWKSLIPGSSLQKYCNREGFNSKSTVTSRNIDRSTFGYDSSYWTNKKAYHVNGGQSGADHQETKLPTYWATPFTSLCLGMMTVFQRRPNWIRVNYK